MDVYSYIEINRGMLSVFMDSEAILREFKFSSNTAALKKAVEKSIDKCIATDIVDELLKSKPEVILEMYHTLHKINQKHLASCFHEEFADSDKEFDEYIKVKDCSEELTEFATLQLDTLINVLMIHNIMNTNIISELVDDDVLSMWHASRIRRLHSQFKTYGALLLLLTQINTKYKFSRLKAYFELYCKEALQYL